MTMAATMKDVGEAADFELFFFLASAIGEPVGANDTDGPAVGTHVGRAVGIGDTVGAGESVGDLVQRAGKVGCVAATHRLLATGAPVSSAQNTASLAQPSAPASQWYLRRDDDGTHAASAPPSVSKFEATHCEAASHAVPASAAALAKHVRCPDATEEQ